jgi:hypothetical protein
VPNKNLALRDTVNKKQNEFTMKKHEKYKYLCSGTLRRGFIHAGVWSTILYQTPFFKMNDVQYKYLCMNNPVWVGPTLREGSYSHSEQNRMGSEA